MRVHANKSGYAAASAANLIVAAKRLERMVLDG
jgi:hypothetical protein